MKHRLMDLLACPVEKGWPLKMEIIEEETDERELELPIVNDETQVVCRYYCNYKNYVLVNVNEKGEEVPKPLDEIKKHVTLEDCKKCFKIEIKKGMLYCPKDSTHTYKIKDGIPIMLTPDQIKEIYGGKLD